MAHTHTRDVFVVVTLLAKGQEMQTRRQTEIGIGIGTPPLPFLQVRKAQKAIPTGLVYRQNEVRGLLIE